MNARTAYEVVMSLSKTERKSLYKMVSEDMALVSKVKPRKCLITRREADKYILKYVFKI